MSLHLRNPPPIWESRCVSFWAYQVVRLEPTNVHDTTNSQGSLPRQLDVSS